MCNGFIESNNLIHLFFISCCMNINWVKRMKCYFLKSILIKCLKNYWYCPLICWYDRVNMFSIRYTRHLCNNQIYILNVQTKFVIFMNSNLLVFFFYLSTDGRLFPYLISNQTNEYYWPHAFETMFQMMKKTNPSYFGSTYKTITNIYYSSYSSIDR